MRGGLVWKYAVLFVVLVGGALVASSAIELYFSYQENKAALVALQKEKAQTAAVRIEAFVREIERQTEWVTQPQLVAPAAALDQRRLDYVRLERQVPAITEISYLDPTGKEQIRMSRLAPNVMGSQTDFSGDPKFREARRGTWFGPVYFRKESEPYMTMSMPHPRGGGVTVVEVNLKFIWDVVSQIRVGKAGRAYVVDAAGTLIAHPDISLVLQKTSLASLDQVRAAVAVPGPGAMTPEVSIARDREGRQVLSAWAPIRALGWTVLAEQPVEEAFEPLRASIQRTLALLGIGIALAIVASGMLARRMVRPIRALQEGAARIGAGELTHRLDVRSGDEIERLAGEFNRMTERLQESYATLERRVEERTRELSEALEQQTATAEILRVISSSPTDVEPVFRTILASATRLCDANIAALFRYDGEFLRAAAHHNATPEFAEYLAQSRLRPSHETTTRLAALEHRTVHVRDLLNDPAFAPPPVHRRENARTVLSVPMLREGVLIGVITTWRREVRPFTDKQVELVQTFADQAVIAIENVRLFTELEARNRDLTTALDQQTATAEILRVISRSSTDARPVFQTIVDSATRLLRGHSAVLSRIVDERIDLAAYTPTGEVGDALLESLFPMPLHSTGADARPIRERVIGQRIPYNVADVETDPRVGERGRVNARARGYRSQLVVPMLRDDEPIGTIAVTRAEPGAFGDEEIALLQTFADQAVIAIENARLFTELQEKNRAVTEALEQQTATAEILRVISSSPTDVQPVFDAIVGSAQRLLKTFSAAVVSIKDGLLHLEALTSTSPVGDDSLRARFPRPVPEGMPGIGRMVDERIPYTIVDTEDADIPAISRDLARARGYRSIMWVPLVREDTVIGMIAVTRRSPGGFNDDEVELLKTFADQAVIAIENVRMFTELQEKNRAVTEALEQQTATAEILRVISSSPTDVQPVLDAVAESAARLCGAVDALILRVDGDVLHRVAHFGEIVSVSETRPVTPGTPSGRAVVERRMIHVPDILEAMASGDYAEARALQQRTGFRTVLSIPLMRENTVVGVITIRRVEARPFTDKQIALVETFADQAVIAIENVRLFTELQETNRAVTEALQQQTATSEILRVISSSPTEVQPVFDTIVHSAVRLLRGFSALVLRVEDDAVHLGAMTSVNEAADAVVRSSFPRPLGEAGAVQRVVATGEPYVISDTETDSSAEATIRRNARARGYRSLLFVPMLREGRTTGLIVVTRSTPGPFAEDEIGLLETFADQAVIAIENVRLFTELQERNREVTEALEQQTATANILAVISSSPTDVEPVFAAIVQSGLKLFPAAAISIGLPDGDQVRAAAVAESDTERALAWRNRFPFPLTREYMHGTAILDRRVVDIPDVAHPGAEWAAGRQNFLASGYRAITIMPMMRGEEAIGALSVVRVAPGPLSDKQVAVLKTLADQAVIAIENVRLFTELRERTRELARSVEQLTALGEVSRAVSSTLDLDRVLNTVVSRASELAGADGCSIYEYDDAADGFRVRATQQLDEELLETQRAVVLRRGEGAVGRLATTRESVQVPDIAEEPAYWSPMRDALLRGGYRALLAVPMVHEDRVVGGLVVSRKLPGEFPGETVELLKTFANQSALAIQNARLFREIERKSGELEVANRHKSEFLASMSHELRTPLNAVIGFSEVLLERMFGDLNDKQEEYLRDIYSSGRHLLSLINDILDLAKIEAGRMDLEVTRFDLPQAIENAVTLVRGRASAHGIRLDTQVDPRLGDFAGDERKVKQILLNLLSNAVKFTPEGGRITLRAAPADGAVEIAVADTGIGIAPEDQATVFEEFRQVGADYARKREGTGLGLALTKRFVELHGGTIGLESVLGEGSTFTFTLPVRPWPTRSS